MGEEGVWELLGEREEREESEGEERAKASGRDWTSRPIMSDGSSPMIS